MSLYKPSKKPNEPNKKTPVISFNINSTLARIVWYQGQPICILNSYDQQALLTKSL